MDGLGDCFSLLDQVCKILFGNLDTADRLHTFSALSVGKIADEHAVMGELGAKALMRSIPHWIPYRSQA